MDDALTSVSKLDPLITKLYSNTLSVTPLTASANPQHNDSHFTEGQGESLMVSVSHWFGVECNRNWVREGQSFTKGEIISCLIFGILHLSDAILVMNSLSFLSFMFILKNVYLCNIRYLRIVECNWENKRVLKQT